MITSAITNNNRGTKNTMQTMTSADIARNVEKVQYLLVIDILLVFEITLTSKNTEFTPYYAIMLII